MIDTLALFWWRLGEHLWQTSIVLGLLWLLSLTLRKAPGRLVSALWTLGWIKLVIPMAFVGVILPQSGATSLTERLAVVPATAALVFGDPPGLSGASIPGAAWLVAGWTALWAVAYLMFTAAWLRQSPNSSPLAVPVSLPRPLANKLDAALEAAGIERSSVEVDVRDVIPHVSGLLRPRIRISEEHVRQLPAFDLGAMLAHEDHHRRRFDPLRLLAMQLIVGFFIYYPPAWWLLRKSREAGELSADEAAIRSGFGPRHVAGAIARSLALGVGITAAPAAGDRNQRAFLQRRFSRLRNFREVRPMNRHKLAIAAAVLVFAAITILPTAPNAGSSKNPDDAKVEMPKVLEMVQPEYPEDGRKAGVEGRIDLIFVVLADGSIGETELVAEIEGYPSFSEAALEAIAKWQFKPAEKDGKPVDMKMRVPFDFKLSEGGEKDKGKPSKEK